MLLYTEKKRDRINKKTGEKMIKFIAAILLIVFDFGPKNGNCFLDIFPDFIGFGIFAYGYYRIKAQNQGNEIIKSEAFLNSIRTGIMSSVIMTIVTYIHYLMWMYGIYGKVSSKIYIMINFVMDLLFVAALLMYIGMLEALQGKNRNFQVKRMRMLWGIYGVCILGEYLMSALGSGGEVLDIFSKVVMVIFVCYVGTSSITYKQKFIKKDTGIRK